MLNSSSTRSRLSKMKDTNLFWKFIRIAVLFQTQLKNSCATKKLKCQNQILSLTVWLTEKNRSPKRSNWITMLALKSMNLELTSDSTHLRNQTLQKIWMLGKVLVCWLVDIACLTIRSKCWWRSTTQRMILFSLHRFLRGYLIVALWMLRGLSSLRGMGSAFMI